MGTFSAIKHHVVIQNNKEIMQKVNYSDSSKCRSQRANLKCMAYNIWGIKIELPSPYIFKWSQYTAKIITKNKFHKVD